MGGLVVVCFSHLDMARLTIRTVDDKTAILKERQNEQRRLGALVDKLQAEAEDVGCGGVMRRVWRVVCGRRAVASGEGGVSATDMDTTMRGRIAAGDPAVTKLAEAAVAMETRLVALEERVCEQRLEAMRLMKAGQKSAALRVLKKSKQTEKQVETSQAPLDAVEQQADLLAQAAMQKTVASALSKTSKGMIKDKKMLRKAENTVEEATEARDMAEDLSQVMSDFVSNGAVHDMDDLLEELREMVTNDGGVGGRDEEDRANKSRELETQHTAWDAAERLRRKMPAVPVIGGKEVGGMVGRGGEKAKLLAS